MKYEVFIAIHDQDLLLTMEKNKIFKNLKKYRYVFLGNRPINKIRHLKNVIIARELPINIEKYKLLCDFTGWYALIKNNLIKTDFVSLIQYDSLIKHNFNKKTVKMLKKYPNSLIGYQPHPQTEPAYLEDRFNKGMADAIKKYYHIDVKKIVEASMASGDMYWPAATSICCSKKILTDFVNWVEPMLEDLGADPIGGLGMERGVKFFCIIKKINNQYIPNVLKHIFACSHDMDYAPEELKQLWKQYFILFLNNKHPDQINDSLCKRIFRSIYDVRYDNKKVIRFLGIKFKLRNIFSKVIPFSLKKSSIPGKIYKDMMLNFSGACYEAPVDGYFFLHKVAGDKDAFIQMTNNSNGLSDFSTSHIPAYGITCRLPVKKGDIVSITYTATGPTFCFRFISCEN